MKAAALILFNVLKVATGNLLGMFVSWKFIKWSLTKLTKATDNKIDDAVVDLVDAAYNNDEEGVKKYAEQILSNFGDRGA